jgi:beta-phosphoglucomutase
MTRRAVLWDLDGTLVDSEQYHWLAWRDTMAVEGVTLTHDQFLKTFGLRNDAVVPQWTPGASTDRIQRIANAKEHLYRRLVREGGLVPLPGAAEWTQLLANEGWRQAIASSSPRENIDAVLAVIGLASVFQAVVSAEDVTLGKPDPQVFLTAASRPLASRAVHCGRRCACRHRSCAPRRDAEHRGQPQRASATSRPGGRVPGRPSALRVFALAQMTQPYTIECVEPISTLVPGKALHVWKVFASACYRYGLGIGHNRSIRRR